MEKDSNDRTKSNIKHIPIRTCVGTGQKFPKLELLRVISKDNAFVEYDITGKKQGRGANLSMSHEALELALKKHAFERSFKRKLSNEEIQYLKDNFDDMVEQKKFRSTPNKKVVLRISKDQFEDIKK